MSYERALYAENTSGAICHEFDPICRNFHFPPYPTLLSMPETQLREGASRAHLVPVSQAHCHGGAFGRESPRCHRTEERDPTSQGVHFFKKKFSSLIINIMAFSQLRICRSPPSLQFAAYP